MTKIPESCGATLPASRRSAARVIAASLLQASLLLENNARTAPSAITGVAPESPKKSSAGGDTSIDGQRAISQEANVGGADTSGTTKVAHRSPSARGTDADRVEDRADAELRRQDSVSGAGAGLLGEQIESALSAAFDRPKGVTSDAAGGGDATTTYRQQAQALVFALAAPGNDIFRKKVLSGDLPPAALARMSSSEFAAPEVARAREQERKTYVERMSSSTGGDWLPVRDLKCAKCGAENAIQSLMLQQARDIGKNETWGNKDRPEEVRRFRCTACGDTWIEES